jgi:hypothetical protein
VDAVERVYKIRGDVMKFKTTKKNMEQNYSRIANVGYCTLQNLLNYESPIAYSSGTYGWNGDYYEVEGVLIATGYRSLPKTTLEGFTYDIAREYDKKAIGTTKKERDILISEFVKAIS